MKSKLLAALCGLFATVAAHAADKPAQAASLDRTILPIPQPVPALITEPDVRKATMPPRLDLTAPKGAPNVLLVLIDDMGFGQPAAFGGPIKMPTLDRIAQQGRGVLDKSTDAKSPRLALPYGTHHGVDGFAPLRVAGAVREHDDGGIVWPPGVRVFARKSIFFIHIFHLEIENK